MIEALSPIISIQTPAPRSILVIGCQVLARLSSNESGVTGVPLRCQLPCKVLENLAFRI
jgi:hypothetical protein